MSAPPSGHDTPPGTEWPTLAATVGPDTAATGAHEAVTDLTAGQRVGRYVVIDRVGAGGMGVVYSAHDDELDRPIALKVVRGGGSSARLLRAQKRLQREARAMAALSHPNVVTVHDVLVDDDRLCVAMELIDGGSLREWCKTNRTTEEIVRTFIQAGRGLGAAHRAGLVHRDFKPDNVLIDESGRVRVSDFGLARTDPTSGDVQSADSDERTIAGAGTPAYMAPEQFARAPVDSAADQFAFCVALHEALCGTRPFAGTTAHEIAAAVTRGDRVALPRGTIPPRLRPIIDRGLRRVPAERWPSMDALVQQLERAIEPRRRWPWLLSASGVAAVGVWLAWPAPEPECAEATAARVAAAWNDAVRREREQGYAARSRRPEAWTDVAQVVDAWVGDWHATRDDLCGSAASLAVDRDAGLQCLRERTAVLERTVESLDPATLPIARAPALVREMPRPGGCADPAVLVALPVPEDPVLGELARTIGEATASVETLAKVGRYADAMALGTAMVQAAEPLGDAAVVLYLRRELANVLLVSGKPDEARELLEGIYWTAESAGHDGLAADASAMLLHVASRTPGFDIERWVSFARAASERAAPERPLARAWFLGGLGAVRFAEHRMVEAVDAFSGQLALLEELDAPPMAIVTTKQNVSAILMTMGRIDEGEALCREVIAAFDAGLGAHHPELANPLLNLSNTLADRRHEYPEAIAAAKRAHAILAESHGPGAPPTIHAQLTLAEAQADGKRCDDAIATTRDALAQIAGDEDQWLARVVAHSVLAQCLHEVSRSGEAVHELVLAEQEIPSETEHVMALVRAHGKVGTARSAMGDPEGALRSFQAVRQLALTHPGAELILGYSTNIGELHLQQGRYAEAAVFIEEGMPYLDMLGSPKERAAYRMLLGSALWRLGHDRMRAVAIVRAARDVPDLPPAERAFVELWLAAHPDPGDELPSRPR